MRYLIIGLGIYGANLARDLTDMGHEVIGADLRAPNVEAIKDYISTAYILDSTDEASLSALPLKNVDLVIVAIGENFGASVKTVALLRKLGIRKIYARAIDELHQSILEGLKVERILTPEQRAAHDLVNEMELSSQVATLRIGRDTFAMRFSAPEIFHHMKYSDITPDTLRGLRLIAAARPSTKDNILGIPHNAMETLPIPVSSPDHTPPKPAGAKSTDNDLRVEPGDIFLCLGTTSAYKSLFRSLN